MQHTKASSQLTQKWEIIFYQKKIENDFIVIKIGIRKPDIKQSASELKITEKNRRRKYNQPANTFPKKITAI